MQGRQFKDAIYEQFARVGRAVCSPKRLELLDLLCQGPRTVEILARESGQSVANTSQHLQVLRAARLIEAEKHGLFVEYRLAGPEVCEFYRSMRILAESRLTEIDAITKEFLEERDSMEPVDQDDLIRRVRDGSVTVLDVRPTEEFEAGHIPGAKCVPLDELVRHLATLPKRRKIVAYCRGPYCVLAVEAVRILRAKGFRAVRLEDGIPDWRARGLQIAVGGESNEHAIRGNS
ncbi:MAG: metalloregulator ArsR/SmtB family transcription factor [Deltaproteobacteria bacterium]|nr:metalloregulator ArsR/SmtB family transcription factor [Deltaproteobacteria bacterium]